VRATETREVSATERASIRRSLRSGLTPDMIQARAANRSRAHEVFLTALEEEARLDGTFRSIVPTPANVARLRDRDLRWERIAVRVFGEPRWVVAAKVLYDAGRGKRSSRRSYTGKGRRFRDMNASLGGPAPR
jgi:hypothetical protein